MPNEHPEADPMTEMLDQAGAMLLDQAGAALEESGDPAPADPVDAGPRVTG